MRFLLQLQEEIFAPDAALARRRGEWDRRRVQEDSFSQRGAEAVPVVRRHPDGGQVALQPRRLLAPQDRRGVLLRGIQGRGL